MRHYKKVEGQSNETRLGRMFTDITLMRITLALQLHREIGSITTTHQVEYIEILRVIMMS